MDIAQRLHELLGPDHFPQYLVERYPHLATRLLQTWGTPALDIFMNDLFFDRRGGRQGFEAEVMQELFSIQSLYNQRFPQQESSEIWTETDLATEELRADYLLFDAPHLMEAAKTGNLEFISNALASGVSIDYRDEAGLSMLWWACRYGHRELIVTLLKARAVVDVADELGCSPMHWLAAQDLLSAIEELQHHGADINARDVEGASPLMYATRRSRVAAAGCLLQLGADVNLQDKKGMSALHYAAEVGSGHLLELLMAYGADKNLLDCQGRSAEDILRAKPGGQRLLAYLM
ncbi:ankyrin repeat domain-containing protein [Chitinibacter sp. S2-10]|uniref:ankyrin repeat domain-containing protein n=1 Tax=Chitinibacter sp. S2-10 TaxID=3373597 RepID=UPI0039777457